MSMQAVHIQKPGDPSVLAATTLPIPELETPYDILVKIRGCGLNPVDTSVRSGGFPGTDVLGYDGAGVVAQAGEKALFAPGDEVFYAGALNRKGTNAQYSLVDSRIVGRKPKTLSWAEAAAFPLVGLTAWEMLEGHMRLKPLGTPTEETIVIVNGAGGVGSIATQLASKIFGIKNVVVSASRPETIEWVKKNGATHVINHREDIGSQIKDLKLTPELAFICYGQLNRFISELLPTMRAWPQIGSIVNERVPVELGSFDAFSRAVTFHWELMFSKTIHGFDLESQGRILNQISQLIDDGKLTGIATRKEVLSAKSLREMHEFIGTGKSIGKIVFEVQDTIQ